MITNLDYYGAKNLKVSQWDLDDSGVFVVFAIDYIPKYSKEEIRLFSKVVYKQDLNAVKARWFLEEPRFELNDDPINVDNMYEPKHAKKPKKQFCFEG